MAAGTKPSSTRLLTGALIVGLLAAGCAAASSPTTTRAVPRESGTPTTATLRSTTLPAPAVSTSSSSSTSQPSRTYALGGFPGFPGTALAASTSTTLQSLLDVAVEEGFRGVTAAVIVADRGNWAGTSGMWDGAPITADSRYPTHSSAKTFVAAEILRLVEDGKLGLDDLAADHLPPELSFVDANGATIREVLGMRSGLPSLDEDDAYYVAELVPTAVALFTSLPEPFAPPGSETRYSGTNYVLLGAIIEHITGRPLADVLHSGVLAHPGLEGIVHTVPDAMASDGWGVETTTASLARWGYDLFGGSVLSDASLREMTDFDGEWYGLGIMDYPGASGVFNGFAVGHQGLSSATTCCSAVALVVLPDQGIVIAVQADTSPNYGTANTRVDRLAKALADVAAG